MKIKNFNKKGFSLIEVLLYVSLLSVTVFVLVIFMQKMLEVNNKQKLVSQVNFESERNLNLITQYLRDAKNINSPSKGNADSVLSFETFDVDKSPTIVSVVNGKLMIREGASPQVALNSEKINTSDLIFTNLGSVSGKDSIKINFKAVAQTDSVRSEYNYEKNYEAAVSFRN